MTCHVCNAQNSAMTARCLECGTVLIAEAVPASSRLKQASNAINWEIYAGFGGLAGFAVGFVSWMIVSQDDEVLFPWVAMLAVVGAALGRYIATQERLK